MTLHAILDGTESVFLTRKQRFYVAFTLTSAFLQLHSTPWLAGDKWSNFGIFFPRESSDAISVEEPYISKGVVEGCSSKESGARANHGILLLGIMLLEVAFHKTLERYDKD